MSTPTTTQWKCLEPRPKSFCRQLFIKGTRIRAEVIFGLHVNEVEPMTPEAIAAEYSLPLEAVQEAIAYCQCNPPEIERDLRREEYHPTPNVLTAQEMARIRRL
jgi:uncharacterized protein (DUF433 family)